MKNQNYSWLIGVELGDYVYNGMYWQTDDDGKKYGNNQYEFINEQGIMVLTYKEFIEYINQYDLSEYKKINKGKVRQ